MKLSDLYTEAKSIALGAGERKYSLLLVSFLVLLLAFFLTAFWTLLSGQYTVFVGGIITLYGIYCGANVGSQFSPQTATEQKAVALAVKTDGDIKAQTVQNTQDVTAKEVETSKSVTAQVNTNTAGIASLQKTKKDK